MPASPGELPSGENTYVIDVESAAEMGRLLDQDKLLTSAMDGLFPEIAEPNKLRDVLDIACGPGGWVHQVAFAYPRMQVVGIDISKSMIEYARVFAEVRKLPNAHFHVMDALKPLDFASETLDLVNARFLFAFMPPAGWPKLLQECHRIMRPGGNIRLTECEFPVTNSPAFEKLSGLFTQALYLAGQSFSPDGRGLGITPMLGKLLNDAGFQRLRERAHVLHASASMEAHQSFYRNFEAAYKLAEPFLIKLGLISPIEFDTVYTQAMLEVQADQFCAVWFYLSVSGEKA